MWFFYNDLGVQDWLSKAVKVRGTESDVENGLFGFVEAVGGVIIRVRVYILDYPDKNFVGEVLQI